jgi:hypothetical protein
MPSLQWLLFLYSLPARQASARISLWRQLKRLGAVSLKTSASILPCTPEHEESFQWLADKLVAQGGAATLVKVAEISGMKDSSVIDLFQDARTADYTALKAVLTALGKGEAVPTELTSRFQAIRSIDFFQCPAATGVQALLDKRNAREQPAARGRLKLSSYQGRVWQTRPRPVIDRIGSAWLIARFIDKSAQFVFSTDPTVYPQALRFDMTDAHFGHVGDACSFETLCQRFGLLKSAALKAISEIIHDADLHDGKFGRVEGDGLLATFRGWSALKWSDEHMLARGFDVFDGLYQTLTDGSVGSPKTALNRKIKTNGKRRNK